MKTEELIETIKWILQEYWRSDDIDTLHKLWQRLALNLVFLWERLAELKLDYNMKYYNRKISISHSYINNRREKITDRQSLEMANSENKELIKEELEWEALVVRVENFLRQNNRVLDTIRSRASYLKTEKDRLTVNDIV